MREARKEQPIRGKVEGGYPAQGAIVDVREMGGMSAAARTDGQEDKMDFFVL